MPFILDLDDALMSRRAVGTLRKCCQSGHDLILGAMFRPDKPLKLYWPDFRDPRTKWGGEVWTHLRSFKKNLFDSIPDDHLQNDGQWIPECTDYATMIPMVEIAQNPAYVPEYFYLHERTTPRTGAVRARKDAIILRILEKPALNRGVDLQVMPAP